MAQNTGQRVHAQRKAKGLTQEALARRADLSTATIQRIENGRRRPTVATLEAIAAALDVPIGALLGAAAPPTAAAS